MRDGMFVVGQFLGCEPVTRRDGSPVGSSQMVATVRTRRSVFEGKFWATSTDRETGERFPSEIFKAFEALGLAFGDRVELRIDNEVNEYKGRTYVNWNVFGVERAAAEAPVLGLVNAAGFPVEDADTSYAS